MSVKNEKKRPLVPRLRFPEFQEDWVYAKLGCFLDEYSERVSASTDLPIYSSTREGLKSQKEYFDGQELLNDGEYGVVPSGYFVYRHMSDDNIFAFNMNAIGKSIAVSKEYPVFDAKNINHYFFILYAELRCGF